MTYAYICEGFGCSEQASNTIQFVIDKASTITLNLCDNCVKKLQGSDSSNKKTLEQQLVVEPRCSNVSYKQPNQKPGGFSNG
jgi:protein-arginine kinase activator protein McsA